MKQFILLFSVSLVIFGCSTNNNGTVTVVPLAPTNLTGSVIFTTQINLSWTDNATTEDGYKIERKTGTGNYAVIGSTASNMTTFSDLGLTPNTSYTYRVYGYNSAGNSLQYSNEVTLSTQDSIPSWLTNGLVGYWPFNGNANDESGNGNNGTVNGATLTIDRNGETNRAYSFNGTSTILVNDADILDLTNDFTIVSWLNSNSYPTNPFGGPINMILCKRPSVVSDITGTYSFGVWEDNGAHKVTCQAPPNASSITYPGINGSIQLNEWYCFVTTYDDTNKILKYYLNGVEIFNSNLEFIITNTSYGLSIGGLASASSYFWNGFLDDIRLYNRALSASEVAYLATH